MAIAAWLLLATTWIILPATAEARTLELAFHNRATPAPPGNDALADFGFEGRIRGAAAARLGQDGIVLATERKGAIAAWRRPVEEFKPDSSLMLLWRVDRYPAGANWDSGPKEEAIMATVFFGERRFGSGLPLLLPSLPYFIGFFLCGESTGTPGQIYIGRTYSKQGRYVCIDTPAKGALISTKIDVQRWFKAAFPNVAALPITAIGLSTSSYGAAGPGGGVVAKLELHERD